MKTTAVFTYLMAVLAGAAFSQTPAEVPPENAAVLALAREYEAAFAKGDDAALAAFFAEDAEQTTEDGTVLRGRAEIQKAIREGLVANKGAKLAISVDSVRLLAPEVAVEKGATTVTATSGDVSSSLYTAVHVKKDGKWKISQLTETVLPPPTPRERLAELEWLLGEWEETDKAEDLAVRSLYMWARGGNFLSRSVTVKRAGNVTLEGWQIIGWDPIQERLRSWTFDGEGGFADGTFTRDGERWLLRETGVAPDGSRTSADNTITRVSPDRLTWESHNRTFDGEPMPSIGRIEINRVKGN